jgi:hypothetical protein
MRAATHLLKYAVAPSQPEPRIAGRAQRALDAARIRNYEQPQLLRTAANSETMLRLSC